MSVKSRRTYSGVVSSPTMLEGTFHFVILTVFAPHMLRVFVVKRQKYSQRLTVKINDCHVY